MSSTKKTKPVMPDFKNIQVSTKTVIAQTNASYDIQKLYEKLPVSDYVVVKKRRGRRKNTIVEDPNKDLPSGSIITLKYFDNVKGVVRKAKKKKGKFFRNAVSIVMKVMDKFVNFKLSKNGKFQMTGVKTNKHAVECVKHLWKHILDLGDHTLVALKSDKLRVTFKVVMTNVDFSLGFLVNRSNLDRFFNSHTEYNSLLETSFGYTGVNIKFPSQECPYKELMVHEMTITDNFTPDSAQTWTETKISFDDYLETLTEVDRNKELTKKRYNTFLVFHSGNVIMSGALRSHMQGPYYQFLQIVKECRSEIEEKLEE